MCYCLARPLVPYMLGKISDTFICRLLRIFKVNEVLERQPCTHILTLRDTGSVSYHCYFHIYIHLSIIYPRIICPLSTTCQSIYTSFIKTIHNLSINHLAIIHSFIYQPIIHHTSTIHLSIIHRSIHPSIYSSICPSIIF